MSGEMVNWRKVLGWKEYPFKKGDTVRWRNTPNIPLYLRGKEVVIKDINYEDNIKYIDDKGKAVEESRGTVLTSEGLSFGLNQYRLFLDI